MTYGLDLDLEARNDLEVTVRLLAAKTKDRHFWQLKQVCLRRCAGSAETQGSTRHGRTRTASRPTSRSEKEVICFEEFYFGFTIYSHDIAMVWCYLVLPRY